jgi:hypothetical protein
MKSAALTSILGGGLVLGILDVLESIAFVLHAGGSATHVLQSIATGVLGPDAFKGGTRAALVGLAVHFAISFVVAAVYWIASRYFNVLSRHPWVCGLLYGCGVFLFMNFVALPLSAAVRPPRVLGVFLHGMIKHAFLVGLPVALITAYTDRARTDRARPVRALAGLEIDR